MKIAIDCRYIGKSGIGTYIENVASIMINKYPIHQYLVITDNVNYAKGKNNVDILYTNIKPFSLKEIFSFPVKKINECDVFFTPYINLPLGIKVPVYTTIHDVIFLDLSGMVSRIGRLTRKVFIWNAVRKSKSIFTVSHFSEGRIKYHFGSNKPIVVTYCAISNYLKKETQTSCNKEDYYIYVGNIKKHKGLRVLVEAFNKAKKNGLSSKLYIVGDDTKFRSREEEFNEVLKTSKDVFFTGFLSNDELIAKIKSAKALVLPSFYEGFGLPPMEALYLGTNAIISDIDVFKEIYKDFPVTYFRTGDSNELANILLYYKGKPFDVVAVRKQIDKRYNFDTVTQVILETITNDYTI